LYSNTGKKRPRISLRGRFFFLPKSFLKHPRFSCNPEVIKWRLLPPIKARKWVMYSKKPRIFLPQPKKNVGCVEKKKKINSEGNGPMEITYVLFDATEYSSQ
jgi:hypothetical protein